MALYLVLLDIQKKINKRALFSLVKIVILRIFQDLVTRYINIYIYVLL